MKSKTKDNMKKNNILPDWIKATNIEIRIKTVEGGQNSFYPSINAKNDTNIDLSWFSKVPDSNEWILDLFYAYQIVDYFKSHGAFQIWMTEKGKFISYYPPEVIMEIKFDVVE